MTSSSRALATAAAVREKTHEREKPSDRVPESPASESFLSSRRPVWAKINSFLQVRSTGENAENAARARAITGDQVTKTSGFRKGRRCVWNGSRPEAAGRPGWTGASARRHDQLARWQVRRRQTLKRGDATPLIPLLPVRMTLLHLLRSVTTHPRGLFSSISCSKS